MTQIAKFSRDGRPIADDDDILRDGQFIRVPVILTDAAPTQGRLSIADALPPGVTMLADGSAKHVFPDGSSVVMAPDRSVRYLDCSGAMSQGLTHHQYLFAAQRAGGDEGRQKALDGIIDAAAHREAMIDRLGNAWR